jgi:type I restriction-modification system DNA methylase subunit
LSQINSAHIGGAVHRELASTQYDQRPGRPYVSYTQSDRVDIVLTNPPFGGREEDRIESNFPKHF